MWPDYMGLDPEPVRDLAKTTHSWQASVDEALTTVREAETLSGEPANVSPMLEQVGYDGRTMSAAINAAVNEVESFRVPRVDTSWTGAMDGMIAAPQLHRPITSGAADWNQPAYRSAQTSSASATSAASPWNQRKTSAEPSSMGAYWDSAMDGMVPAEATPPRSTHHPRWQAAAQDGFVPGGPAAGSVPASTPFVLDMSSVTRNIDSLAAGIERLGDSHDAGVVLDDASELLSELETIGRQVTIDEAQSLGRPVGTWVHTVVAAVATDWGVDYDEGALLHRREQILTQEPTVELHHELVGIATALRGLHRANRKLIEPRESTSFDLNTAIQKTMDDFEAPLATTPIDRVAHELAEIRHLWNQADRIEAAAGDIPDHMAYARPSILRDATDLRQRAWRRVEGIDADPAQIIGAMVSGGAAPRDLAKGIALQRAQRLYTTAQVLVAPGLAFERDALHDEIRDIMAGVLLATPARSVLGRFGTQLSPYETVLVADYAMASADGGEAILTAHDPLRVLEIVSQGYTEGVAVQLAATGPSTAPMAMTFGELEAQLGHLEEKHAANSRLYDVTLGELSRRTQDMGGVPYAQADLDAARLAERTGASYGQALAAVIETRVDAIGGSPVDRAGQFTTLTDDFTILAQVRNDEAHRLRLDGVGGSPADRDRQLHLIDEQQQAKPPAEASGSRMLDMVRAGAPVSMAMSLDDALGGWVSGNDAARIGRQTRRLIDKGVADDEAAGLAVAANEAELSLDEILELADVEGIDLPSAFALAYEANRRDMTVAEFHTYEGLRDQATFLAIDVARGGDGDGQISSFDLAYVIENDSEFSPEVVATATAFRESPRLMARLDTARDFGENVVGHEGFGRDRVDDLLWSRHDLDSFELKQNVNFTLAKHVDLIDVAAEGGRVDEHLSKRDFQHVLDNADELGLSHPEVAALRVVIHGQLYDQNWLERNRDSLALAAAVVAGTAIFVVSGGVGAGLSVALVTSTVASTGASAIAAGVTTLGINSVTDEDLDDGVVTNMIDGGVTGGLAAPGLATGASGWAGASLLGRTSIAVGLAGEGAGLIASGAADWIIDNPFYDGDSIDIANLRADYDEARVVLAGASLAGTVADGRRIVDEVIDAASIHGAHAAGSMRASVDDIMTDPYLLSSRTPKHVDE